MSVIYLKHPLHGKKVATLEAEAEQDRANGWEDFDPVQTQTETPAPPGKPRRGRPRKVPQ